MRIVQELGTSWAWSGRPATGIVRVERKFAGYLLDRVDLESAFCRYDPVRSEYVSIPTDLVRELIRDQPAGDSTTSRVRAKAGGKSAARAFERFVPEAIRPEARQMARGGRDLAQGAYRLARTVPRLLAGGPDSARAGRDRPEPCRIGPDDVYISMGLDWIYNDFDRLDEARRRSGFATVLFCHDTIPVLLPHMTATDNSRLPHMTATDNSRTFLDYLNRLAGAADRVATNSETSRRDFLGLIGEAAPPVDVVILGSDPLGEGAMPRPIDGQYGRPFVLCVGTLEPRKNHDMLYLAWDRLATRHGDRVPDLLLVGMVGWGVGDLLDRIRSNPRTRDRIRVLNHVADEELAWLYRNCLFTIYPSYYEGWGLPVVESLALGKACLTSDARALIEASQGLAPAIDPIDGPGWVHAIERTWLDDDYREGLERRASAEYRPRSWRDFGDGLVAIARELRGDAGASPMP